MNTGAIVSQAPLVPIEHVEGKKYYILIPQEIACLGGIFVLFMLK